MGAMVPDPMTVFPCVAESVQEYVSAAFDGVLPAFLTDMVICRACPDVQGGATPVLVTLKSCKSTDCGIEYGASLFTRLAGVFGKLPASLAVTKMFCAPVAAVRSAEIFQVRLPGAARTWMSGEAVVMPPGSGMETVTGYMPPATATVNGCAGPPPAAGVKTGVTPGVTVISLATMMENDPVTV